MSVATPLRSIVEATRQERVPADYVPLYGLATAWFEAATHDHGEDSHRPRRGRAGSVEHSTAPARMIAPEPPPAHPGFPGRRAYAHWQFGVLGEHLAAEELARLVALDPRWSYLTSIPGGDDSGIDHLAVGPGGVFTIDVRHHHDGSVRVAADTLTVNGAGTRYVSDSRRRAGRAGALLSATANTPVTVRGLVVPVGVADLTVKEQPTDVQVVDAAELVDVLLGLPAVLDAYTIALVLTCARLSTTWRKDPGSATD